MDISPIDLPESMAVLDFDIDDMIKTVENARQFCFTNDELNQMDDETIKHLFDASR